MLQPLRHLNGRMPDHHQVSAFQISYDELRFGLGFEYLHYHDSEKGIQEDEGRKAA
jgi:hypothetical protein